MNENTQLIPIKPSALGAMASRFSVNIEALMNKAIDGKAAVEIIKELRAMHDADLTKAAERAFDEALSAFQSECPVIHKGKGVSDNSGKLAYSYAPIEHIVAEVKPLLQKHGFHFTLDTDVESKDGWVIAKCIVTHALGAKRTSSAKFPLGTATRLMSTTQVYAAALTFASRRVFCMAFGIITGDEDNDGRGDKPKPAGPSTLAAEPTVKQYATQLWNLLKAVAKTDPEWTGKTWKAHNNWLWREDILDPGIPECAPDLTVKRFVEVITATKKKLNP